MEEFLMTMQMAGATLTNEQISELGAEAHEKFGINKDIFMFLLLSGRDDFKKWVHEQASRKLKKDLRSALVAHSLYGRRGSRTRKTESRNGAAVAPSCKDGNLVSDDGKPRDKVSDTVGNMAAGEPARKFIVG